MSGSQAISTRRRWVIGVCATLATVLWAYATSLHWTIALLKAGHLPSLLGLLVDGGLTFSFFRLLAGLCASGFLGVAVVLGSRRLTPCVVVAVAVVVVSFALWPTQPRTGAQIEFAANRDRYAELGRLWDAGDVRVVDRGYHLAELPGVLRHLSVDGEGLVQGDVLFIPLWQAIPDDAGGLLYSPDHSPEGFDMYGMECVDPVLFEDGWWACGMRY